MRQLRKPNLPVRKLIITHIQSWSNGATIRAQMTSCEKEVFERVDRRRVFLNLEEDDSFQLLGAILLCSQYYYDLLRYAAVNNVECIFH